MEMTVEQRTALNEVVAEMKPIVQSIEGSLALTKGHYNEYMKVLASAEKQHRLVAAYCLIQAGADKYGVSWALKLMGSI